MRRNGRGRPGNTQFDFFDTAGLKVAGDWTASRPPTRKKEEAFPNLPFVEFYEDEVTWSVPLQVPPGTAPGPEDPAVPGPLPDLRRRRRCSIPGQWTLPEATLTVGPVGPGPRPPAPAPPPRRRHRPRRRPTPPKSAAAAEGADAPSSRAAVSEAAKTAERGLIPFLLFSALGGLSRW